MLQSFAAIVPKYRVIFFDAYGVLKNSNGVLDGVPDLLAWLIQQGKDLYVITNDASRSPTEMAEAYTHPDHGTLIPPSRTISSGLLAKDFLRSKISTARSRTSASPSSAFYIESAGLTPVPIGSCRERDDVDAIALLDDEGFDWYNDLNLTLNLVRRLNVPVVVANSDLLLPRRRHEGGAGGWQPRQHDRAHREQDVHPLRQARHDDVFARFRLRGRNNHEPAQGGRVDGRRHAADGHIGRQHLRHRHRPRALRQHARGTRGDHDSVHGDHPDLRLQLGVYLEGPDPSLYGDATFCSG